MKNFPGTLVVLFIVITATAQTNLTGVVNDKNNHPLKSATVTISTKNLKKTPPVKQI